MSTFRIKSFERAFERASARSKAKKEQLTNVQDVVSDDSGVGVCMNITTSINESTSADKAVTLLDCYEQYRINIISKAIAYIKQNKESA